MSDTSTSVKFEAPLVTSDSTPVYHYLRFPKDLLKHFGFKGNLRRVICTLNGAETFNTTVFPNKETYLIALNKRLRDKLGITVGDIVQVELAKDESKYGFPMPEEFAEVLRQDPEGKAMFEALTPGNQRIMLQLVSYNKNVDKRIIRSLTGLALLKHNDGKFDYRVQHDGMRAACAFRPDVEFKP